MAAVLEKTRRFLRETWTGFRKLDAPQKAAIVSLVLFLVCSIFASTTLTFVLLGTGFVGFWAASSVVSRVQFVPSNFLLKYLPTLIDPTKPGGKSAEVNRKPPDVEQTKSSENSELVTANTQESQQLSVSYNTQKLISLVLRDFVYFWYDTISDNENVSEEFEHLLFRLLKEDLPARLCKINPITSLCLILEVFQSHVHRYRTARTSLRRIARRGKKVDSSSLITSYETFAILHPAVQSDNTELDYLRKCMDVLQRVLLSSDIVQCKVAHHLLNEILSVNVLQSLVDLISEPDTINEIIVLILSEDDVITSLDQSGAKPENQAAKSLQVESHPTISSKDKPPSYAEAVYRTSAPQSKSDLEQHSVTRQTMHDHVSLKPRTTYANKESAIQGDNIQVPHHELASQGTTNQQENTGDKHKDKGHQTIQTIAGKSADDHGAKVQGQSSNERNLPVAKVNRNSTGAFITSTLNTAALKLIDKIGMKENDKPEEVNDSEKTKVESGQEATVHHKASHLTRKSSGVRLAYLQKLGIPGAKPKDEGPKELRTEFQQDDDQSTKRPEKSPTKTLPLLANSSPQHSPKPKPSPTRTTSFPFNIPFTALGPSLPLLKPSSPKSPTKKEKSRRSEQSAAKGPIKEEVEHLKFAPVPLTALAPSISLKSKSKEDGDTHTDTESSEGGMSRSSSTSSFASITYDDDQENTPFEELDLQFAAPESEQSVRTRDSNKAMSQKVDVNVGKGSKERLVIGSSSNLSGEKQAMSGSGVAPKIASSEFNITSPRHVSKKLSWQGDYSSSFEDINLIPDLKQQQQRHSDFKVHNIESPSEEQHLSSNASSETEVSKPKQPSAESTFQPIAPPPPVPTKTSPKKAKSHPAPLVRSKTTPALLNIQGLSKQEVARSEVGLMEAKVGRFHISAVSIPKTEVIKDRSGKEYILYCIQYEVTAQGVPSKSSSSESNVSGVVTKVVKRRHREFVNLHCRLDENLRFKRVLKGVKEVPRRMGVGLAFGAISKFVYEHRRVSLQQYLQILQAGPGGQVYILKHVLQLIKQPLLGHSEEIAEFLALGGDAHIEFVKKRTDMAPKIDQFRQWAVSSFVGTVKSVVPRVVVDLGAGAQLLSPPVSPKSQRKHATREGAFSPTPQDILDMEWVHKNAELKGSKHTQVQSAANLFLHDHHVKELKPSKPDKTHKPYPPKPIDLGPRFEGDGCDAADLAEDGTKKIPQLLPMEEIELLDKIMVLLTEAMRGQGQPSWILNERLQTGVCVVVGKPLDRWIKTQIEALVSEQWCAYFLTLIQDAIWPNGELIGSTNQRTDEEKEKMRLDALHQLVDIMPDPLQKVIGQEQWKACMEVMLDSLQDPQLNRHLVYTLLDLLLEALTSEITDHEFQDSVLNSYTSLP